MNELLEIFLDTCDMENNYIVVMDDERLKKESLK